MLWKNREVSYKEIKWMIERKIEEKNEKQGIRNGMSKLIDKIIIAFLKRQS